MSNESSNKKPGHLIRILRRLGILSREQLKEVEVSIENQPETSHAEIILGKGWMTAEQLDLAAQTPSDDIHLRRPSTDPPSQPPTSNSQPPAPIATGAAPPTSQPHGKKRRQLSPTGEFMALQFEEARKGTNENTTQSLILNEVAAAIAAKKPSQE